MQEKLVVFQQTVKRLMNWWTLLVLIITVGISILTSSGNLYALGMSCSYTRFGRIIGFALRGYVVAELELKSAQRCRQECTRIANCVSVNVIKSSEISIRCQINNNIKENAAKQQFMKFAGGEYFELKEKKFSHPIKETLDPSSQPYESIGCFVDKRSRAIPLQEGHPLLDGPYKQRTNAIEKCFKVAQLLGVRLFAIQDNGGCSAGSAEKTFNKYGPSTSCATNGRGGSWANQVYYIKDNGIYFFNYSSFWHVPIPMTFYDARQHCLAKGGDLASIASEEEHNFLYETFFPLDQTTGDHKRYIGLNKIGKSEFEWSDGSPVTYIKFAHGQPNNYGGNQNCILLWKCTNYLAHGGFNDYDCESMFDFICEVKL